MTHGITFDFSINLTTIIALVVWIATLAFAWARFGGRIDILDLRVTHIEKTLEQIATILGKFATNEKELALLRQDVTSLTTQIATLHGTVERLRVGEGYITGPRRTNAIGEY